MQGRKDALDSQEPPRWTGRFTPRIPEGGEGTRASAPLGSLMPAGCRLSSTLLRLKDSRASKRQVGLRRQFAK